MGDQINQGLLFARGWGFEKFHQARDLLGVQGFCRNTFSSAFFHMFTVGFKHNRLPLSSELTRWAGSLRRETIHDQHGQGELYLARVSRRLSRWEKSRINATRPGQNYTRSDGCC